MELLAAVRHPHQNNKHSEQLYDLTFQKHDLNPSYIGHSLSITFRHCPTNRRVPSLPQHARVLDLNAVIRRFNTSQSQPGV